ncbi:MAG: hypothetical protein HONBIEJF_00334 [Fimbriimonadaceae bacterium]|nr:hypothetical protein [Fimbriimonadaceae bacterium]
MALVRLEAGKLAIKQTPPRSYGRAARIAAKAMVHKLLSEGHRRILERESAISVPIINEMGAWTATTKAELSDIGFRQEDIRPPALVLPVLTWAGGECPMYSRIRPDSPRMDSKGRPRKYEQPLGQSCRVYCLPAARAFIEGLQSVAGRPLPELDYIFVTEGEKKAAALVSQGLAALGLPGVWNFKNVDALRGDWDLIGPKGQKVCIVFDSDSATNEQVRKAEDRLADMLRAMGAAVYVCRLLQGDDGAKTGADDFFVRGGTVDELDELIEEHKSEKPEKQANAAEGLIELGRSRAKLWHNANREPFATVPHVSGGFDNLPVRDRSFREWLGGEWYHQRKSAAPKDALDRAVDTLAAHAFFEGQEREIARRVGHADMAVWLDLCDDRRRIVRVAADGWDFVADDACPVRFVRPKHAGSLPEPKPGGNMTALSELLSVDADGLPMIEAFLLGAFMPPPGGFPILIATGEQGSGKSFGCRVLRRLIDPAEPSLRLPPKDERDLAAALGSGFILAFDNLASISPKLSDSLCALATGGGIAARKLYTDSEEHVVMGRRPVLINGINDPASAPDLAERSLFVHFVRPGGDDRKAEADLETLYLANAGGILGAVLDRVSRALRDRGKITPPGALPRMADFAAWVHAGSPEAERELVWQFLAQNRAAKNAQTVEEDALSSAVVALAVSGEFKGTAREMLAKLNLQEEINGPKDRPEGWPASADALGKRLRRIAPVLRGVGIEIWQERGKQRVWHLDQKISKTGVVSVEEAATSTTEPEVGSLVDDTSFDTCDGASLKVSTVETSSLNVDLAFVDASDTCDTSPPIPAGTGERRRIEF